MIVLIAASFAYSVFFLLWHKSGLKGKRKQWIYFCISVVLCVAAFVLSVEFDLYRTGIFIIIGVVLFAFRSTYYSSNLQAFYFSTLYVLSIYSSRGIVASVFSMMLNESINDIFRKPTYYNFIWVFAVLLSILILVVRQAVIAPNKKIEQMFNYPDQVKFVTIFRCILIIYMMLIDDGRYRDGSFIWFSTMYLLSCTMVKIVMPVIENHAIKVSVLLEYELNTRQLEQQLARQMRHYQSYKKYTENFGEFQHDFKNMMISVKALISNNEDEKALSLIDEIQNDLKKSSIINNTYSNNIIADAILQDTSNLCEEKQIRFVAMLHLPSILPISDLDLVRLLTNINNNAVEACCRVPVSERVIEINGACIDGWISIEITNSYDGLAAYNGEELPTSKPDKHSHGLGLNIVKQIVENNGGVLLIEANQEKKKFLLKLHIPQQ